MSETIFPIGTQVVTLREVSDGEGNVLQPRHAVGVVVAGPDETGSYTVRFPDEGEARLAGSGLVSRKHFQRAVAIGTEPQDGSDLFPYVIYRCVVGSRAYGLDSEGSDVDRRGFYLPPAERKWSLGGVPEQLERGQSEEVYWELEKFLTLALKANPNVLECLYTPMVEMATPIAEELLGMRHVFLTKLVYQTYNGYVLSQFKKMEQDVRTRGEIRWKHAMHLIRLLLSGVTVLREGFVPVRVEVYRDRLLAIRAGNLEWDEVNRWRLELHKEFAEAYATTRLPEQPDYEWANAFLVRARRSMVDVK